MRPPMLHTAYKVNYTRNAYGDYLATSSTSLPCHFRYISEVDSNTDDETIQFDGLAWFDGSAPIEQGDLVTIEGEQYRVERVIKARRLRNTTVLFLKCFLQRFGQIS